MEGWVQRPQKLIKTHLKEVHWTVMGSCKTGFFPNVYQAGSIWRLFEPFMLAWWLWLTNIGRQRRWCNNWIWCWFSLQKNVKEELLYNCQHSSNAIFFSCQLWHCLCRRDHTSTDGSPHYQQNIWKASLLPWLPSKGLSWMLLFHSSSQLLCFQKTGNFSYLSLLCF